MSFFSKGSVGYESDNHKNVNKVPESFISLARMLIPLNELTDDGFNKALEIANFKKISNRKTLFHLGETDDKTIYLIDGRVELISEDNKKKTIASNQVSAFYPLSNLKPRRFNANTLSKVAVIEFPSEELDRIVHWDHVTMMEKTLEIEVHDATEDDSNLSWVFHLTNSPAFTQFPASNIASLFSAFESMEVTSGQKIIEQGDEGDYYYVIAEGSCDVSKKTSDGQEEILITLGESATFGEEALLSDLPRNATVTMTSDGLLMRLSKANFTHLIKEKSLNWIKPSDVIKKPYVYIDVRSESEFKRDGLDNSINLPLHDLRQKSEELEKNKKYLVYCDNGSRSSSAAYLLAERGFDVSIIKGGLKAFSEEDEQRLSKPAIPENLKEILTDQQLISIRQIENYGGGLWFVRRPLFGDVVPVVRFLANGAYHTAIVEKDGFINKKHDLNIRDD